MPGQARNNRFYVTIPRGVRPGQHFAVLVNGQQMMVRCPEGNRPGDRLIVTSPRTQVQQYVVTVPPNVRSGEQFRVMINNQEVMVRSLHPAYNFIFDKLPTVAGHLSERSKARSAGYFPVTATTGSSAKACSTSRSQSSNVRGHSA